VAKKVGGFCSKYFFLRQGPRLGHPQTVCSGVGGTRGHTLKNDPPTWKGSGPLTAIATVPPTPEPDHRSKRNTGWLRGCNGNPLFFVPAPIGSSEIHQGGGGGRIPTPKKELEKAGSTSLNCRWQTRGTQGRGGGGLQSEREKNIKVGDKQHRWSVLQLARGAGNWTRRPEKWGGKKPGTKKSSHPPKKEKKKKKKNLNCPKKRSNRKHPKIKEIRNNL